MVRCVQPVVRVGAKALLHRISGACALQQHHRFQQQQQQEQLQHHPHHHRHHQQQPQQQQLQQLYFLPRERQSPCSLALHSSELHSSLCHPRPDSRSRLESKLEFAGGSAPESRTPSSHGSAFAVLQTPDHSHQALFSPKIFAKRLEKTALDHHLPGGAGCPPLGDPQAPRGSVLGPPRGSLLFPVDASCPSLWGVEEKGRAMQLPASLALLLEPSAPQQSHVLDSNKLRPLCGVPPCASTVSRERPHFHRQKRHIHRHYREAISFQEAGYGVYPSLLALRPCKPTECSSQSFKLSWCTKPHQPSYSFQFRHHSARSDGARQVDLRSLPADAKLMPWRPVDGVSRGAWRHMDALQQQQQHFSSSSAHSAARHPWVIGGSGSVFLSSFPPAPALLSYATSSSPLALPVAALPCTGSGRSGTAAVLQGTSLLRGWPVSPGLGLCPICISQEALPHRSSISARALSDLPDHRLEFTQQQQQQVEEGVSAAAKGKGEGQGLTRDWETEEGKGKDNDEGGDEKEGEGGHRKWRHGELPLQMHETEFSILGRGGDGMPPPRRQKNVAIVVLNFDLPSFTWDLWEQAGAMRVCADGGANRLYDGVPLAFPHEDPLAVRQRFVPDVIKGDMDSVRPDVLDFYTKLGTKVFNLSEDQDTTDLHKCMQHILDHYPHHCHHTADHTHPPKDHRSLHLEDHQQQPPDLKQRHIPMQSTQEQLRRQENVLQPPPPPEQKQQERLTVLVLGGLGGRVDHEFGHLSVLCTFQHTHVVLLSQYSQLFLLPGGRRHLIRPNRSFEGPHCGVMPIGRESKSTTTTGLRWNLDGTPMAYGKLVSTSNKIAADEITVESDVPLLWTTELQTPSSSPPPTA